MKISTKGRYALRLMIDVAVHGGEEFVSLKDVAARQGISMKYLEQIAGLLGKAGFLRSGRGALGGYRLTKAPEEYTLGSILRLTEGNLARWPAWRRRRTPASGAASARPWTSGRACMRP